MAWANPYCEPSVGGIFEERAKYSIIKNENGPRMIREPSTARVPCYTKPIIQA